jgi:hypothetical protein
MGGLWSEAGQGRSTRPYMETHSICDLSGMQFIKWEPWFS